MTFVEGLSGMLYIDLKGIKNSLNPKWKQE
jgi:hypothetical protein